MGDRSQRPLNQSRFMHDVKRCTYALEARNLSHSYGKFQALKSLDFSIAYGEFTILLGHNGAGKTTLFSLITGLYHSGAGQILVNGRDMRKQPDKALRHLGVVFQQRSLDMDLTVWQNLEYFSGLHGMPLAQAKRRAHEELERLDMLDYLNDKIRNLSGGQARRIEIVRALMQKPELLILDEPTFGLDIRSREVILKHVRMLCADGLSALWTTHLLEEVEPDDKLLLLKSGKLVAQGNADEIAGGAGPARMRQNLAALL